ncbi:MAG: hypothetical protein IKA00_13800 [Prevotella sp.]|nr:hypothetical protein [Prevotella sp.]
MRTIIRYILAACFLLSGLLKIFSLRAFEQEVQLYGDAYIGEWVRDISLEIALLVCVAEIIAGLIAILRIFPILSAFAFVAMLSLFVYLTGVNLFFPTVIGSIESCGCFGELIHFTPLSSFIKSVILLLIAIANLYIVYQKIYIKKTER